MPVHDAGHRAITMAMNLMNGHDGVRSTGSFPAMSTASALRYCVKNAVFSKSMRRSSGKTADSRCCFFGVGQDESGGCSSQEGIQAASLQREVSCVHPVILGESRY